MITKTALDKTIIGNTYTSVEGDLFKVVEYVGKGYYKFIFQDGHIQKARREHILNLKVKNKHHPSVCNVGYLGVGEYRTRENGMKTKAYTTWTHMLQRCYTPSIRDKSYGDCTVCEEWHNFQNFARWFYDNYYEIDGVCMSIDKDIKVEGNKIYSPSTCIIIPLEINMFFEVNSTKSDKELHVGVYFNDCGNYKVMLGRDYIGTYRDYSKAINAYYEARNKKINEFLNKYDLPHDIQQYLLNLQH